MSLNGILLYCARAAAFSAAACAAYILACLARKKRPGLKRLLGLAYLAALLQITLLRGGVEWWNVLHGARSIQPIPLKTTLSELVRGAWPFIYHVLGNMIWFVPLGILLGRRRGYTAMAFGALLSLGIELGQLLLATGAADVDDLLLNALGALLGWALCRLYTKARKRKLP